MTGLKIDEAITAIREAAAGGLLAAAKHVAATSNLHAPIEDSHLIDSSKVSEDSGNLIAAVSYDTDYAIRQHEQMSLRHDVGRSAKFLERAMTSEAGEVARIIAETIHGRIGS